MIDKNRGDVPRSKYITKILEKEYSNKAKEKLKKDSLNSLESKTVNLHNSSESTNQ